jgi:hypothetical protein
MVFLLWGLLLAFERSWIRNTGSRGFQAQAAGGRKGHIYYLRFAPILFAPPRPSKKNPYPLWGALQILVKKICLFFFLTLNEVSKSCFVRFLKLVLCFSLFVSIVFRPSFCFGNSFCPVVDFFLYIFSRFLVNVSESSQL